jgi:hypothetical protein
VRTVGTLDPDWTRLVGLDSVALRSLSSCFRRGRRRLARGDVDLVYFSTTASKLYPYILSRRPVLVVFHQRSGAVDILQKIRAGEAVAFDGSMDVGDFVGRVFETLTPMLEALPYTPNTDWDAFQPYAAEAPAASAPSG